MRRIEDVLNSTAPHAPRLDNKRGAYGLAVAGALLWGSLGIAGIEAVRTSGLSIVDVTACRLLVGGAILLMLGGWNGGLRCVPRTREVASRVAMTSASTAVSAISFLEAVDRLGVASGTVVSMGVCPVFVILASVLRGSRRPPAASLAGAFMALVGLILVCGPDAVAASGDGRSISGAAYGVACGIGFACTTIVNSRPIDRLSASNLAAMTFCGAGLLTSMIVPLNPLGDVHLTLPALSWLVFMALVPTAIGYVAFFAGLQRGVPASSAMVITLLELVSAAGLAVLLLDESIAPSTAIGAALIVGAALVMRPGVSSRDAAAMIAAGP